MSKRLIYFVLPLLLFGLFSCSTTKNLPEGEQLYTGVKRIRYSTDMPKKPKKRKNRARTDSVGVITSVANAVKAVDAALEGRTYAMRRREMIDSMSKQELKEYKEHLSAQRKEFATAKEEVDAVLNYAPNDAFMGSASMRSPIHAGLWAYNSFVNDSTKFGKWMFKTFSTQPIYISTVTPETRVKVAANTLRNYGYFNGKVNYRIVQQKNPKKAKISYYVRTGELYRLDSIEYEKFTPEVDSLIKATKNRSKLKKGDGFSVVNLNSERTRISDHLRRRGYYYYSPSFITYEADTFQRHGFVQLRVKPTENIPPQAMRPWRIGNAHFDIRNEAGEILTKEETFRDATFRYNGKKMPLNPGVWRHSIYLRKGDRYSLMREQLSLQKLNELGVFSMLEMNFIPTDTTDTCQTLDMYVNAVMDKLYDRSLEMNATIKSNSQIGPGLSYSLSKRNAFGGGEKVAFKIFGSYEWQTKIGSKGSNSLLNSYELGTNLSFEFPRFVMPILNRKFLRFPATTTFDFQVDWLNRSGFYQMLTYSLGANYAWWKKRTLKHELDFRMDFDKRLSSTTSFDSILQANPILDVSMRDHFVPSISYTATYNASRKHRNPLWLQFTIKESGNLMSCAYAAAGKKFSETDKRLFNNPFAQFVKLTGEAHHSVKINNNLKLASRFFGGVIFNYGNTLRAPYAEQFYVGGANSVRGFVIRSVGPGGFKTAESKYSYVDQTGDVKLEANLELRSHLFGSLHGAVFLDAGNVWLTRTDESRPDSKFNLKNLGKIAVGTGVGLRYDLEFLILRLDLGVALHAPYKTSKSGWFNIDKFKDAMTLHFAIGYPF